MYVLQRLTPNECLKLGVHASPSDICWRRVLIMLSLILELGFISNLICDGGSDHLGAVENYKTLISQWDHYDNPTVTNRMGRLPPDSPEI